MDARCNPPASGAMKSTLPLLLLLAASFGSLTCPTVRAGGEGQILLWLPQASGRGVVHFSSGAGEARVSIREDVDFRDRSVAPGFLLELGGAQLRARLTLLQADMDVRGDQTATVSLGDQAVTVRGPLTTVVDLLTVRGEGRVMMGGDPFGAGFLAGVQYARLDARFRAVGAELRVQDQEAAFPVVGLFGRVRPIRHLSLKGELVYSRFTWSDHDVEYVEVSAEARAHLGGGWYLGAGYRLVDADVRRDRDALRADARLSGPVVFTGFTW